MIEFIDYVRDYWPLILGFVSVLISIYKAGKVANGTLSEINHELRIFNLQLVSLNEDKEKIWLKLNQHETSIRELYNITNRNDEIIRTFIMKGVHNK